MTGQMWTKDEIVEFDDLVNGQSSRDQVKRIDARMGMKAFIAKHGKTKCDAMFAHLEAGGKKVDGPLLDQQPKHQLVADDKHDGAVRQ